MSGCRRRIFENIFSLVTAAPFLLLKLGSVPPYGLSLVTDLKFFITGTTSGRIEKIPAV